MKRIKYKGQIYEAVTPENVGGFNPEFIKVIREFEKTFDVEDEGGHWYYGYDDEIKEWVDWAKSRGLKDGEDFTYKFESEDGGSGTFGFADNGESDVYANIYREVYDVINSNVRKYGIDVPAMDRRKMNDYVGNISDLFLAILLNNISPR